MSTRKSAADTSETYFENESGTGGMYLKTSRGLVHIVKTDRGLACIILKERSAYFSMGLVPSMCSAHQHHSHLTHSHSIHTENFNSCMSPPPNPSHKIHLIIFVAAVPFHLPHLLLFSTTWQRAATVIKIDFIFNVPTVLIHQFNFILFDQFR